MFVKKFLFILVIITMLLTLFSGCTARYVSRHYHSIKIPENARIGIDLVGKNTSPDLAIFMAAALTQAKYRVQIVNPLNLVTRDIRNRIVLRKKYSFYNSFIKFLYKTKKKHNFSLNDKSIKQLGPISDIKVDSSRAKDYVDFLTEYRRLMSNIKIEYLMVIEQKSLYTYSVRVINIRSETIVGIYFVSANRRGWKASIPTFTNFPYTLVSLDVRKGKTSDRFYIQLQFCQYIVDLMKSARGGYKKAYSNKK